MFRTWFRRGHGFSSPIKSIQRGVIDQSISLFATINKVDINNSLIHQLGTWNADAGTNQGYGHVRVLFNDATGTVLLGTSTIGGDKVAYEVVEYWPGFIRSIQRGTITSGTPVTLNAVNMARTTVQLMGFSSTNGTSVSGAYAYLTLASSTSLTYTASAAGNAFGEYQVIEWY